MRDRLQTAPSPAGAATVALTYVCWGLLPLFWGLLAAVDSFFVLAQRIIWSMVFMGIYAAFSGRFSEIIAAFRHRRQVILCLICGLLITVNWGSYIYAVQHGHVLDASLGYFIEPILVSVLGMIVFQERMTKAEQATFACALLALVYLLVTTKTMPALALIIAGSFALYGAVKKGLSLSATGSLFMETLLMTPLALIFSFYAETHGFGAGGRLVGPALFLLPLCGIVTSVPLLLFNVGVKKIPYYLSGMLMYINPSLQFILGLVAFGEGLHFHRLIAFIIIWIGALFTIAEKIKLARKGKKETPSS